MSDDEDRIASLEREVAELKNAMKPPEPFKPEDWPRYDPTAGMTMPRAALEEMVNADKGMMRGIVRDNRAPTGPSSAGAIPTSQQVTGVRGSGWAREVPIGPPPGIRYVDA